MWPIRRGLDLSRRIARDVPDALLGDAGRLRQVLLNLVGNAIKVPDEGESASACLIDERGRDGCSRFETPHFGIAEEKQWDIFGALVQADAPPAAGLVLTISTQLVEMMDGGMWLDSEPGKGNRFVARFDLARETGEPISSTAAEFLRVLIVDDNETNRVILLRFVGELQMRLRRRQRRRPH